MIAGLLLAAVALVVVVVVGWPVLTGRTGEPTEDTPRDRAFIELDDQIETSLRAIREIEFDHKAGNISDQDFAELDRVERANAARLIRRRDQLRQGGS